jgi:hypothetical protein
MSDLEVGMFSVDVESRLVRGILVPWNERSRVSSTKNKPVIFPPGAVRIPRDVSIVGLNRQHDRYDPFGRAAKLDPEHERGLYAEFTVADTPEGDAWLADHGTLVRLSPELRDIIRDADGETASATLTGAALVDAGAFASAGLFAVDEDEDTETPDEASAESDDEPVTEPDEEKEDAVAEATAAEVMLGGQGKTADKTKERGLFASARDYHRAIDAVMGGRATYEQRMAVAQSMPGEAGLFALSDVDYDGTGGVGAKMVPTSWIGEVLDGTTYAQRYAPLFGQRSLAGLAMAGWKWGVKPAGATWTGNKDAISSNTPTIVPVTENATRWAGGHDIAREHRDFGTPGFFEAYNAAMRESFDRWLDTTIVLTEALAGATDLEADNPASLTIGAGWSAVIDGAASIVAAGLTPTSAVVSPELWKAMAKVPSSDVLGYLNASLSLTGDGRLDSFSIVPAGASQITTGHVLVIARDAADVYTLPGSPIRAEALNIANGGIDVGFFGYGGFLIKNALGIVDVAPYTP